MIGAAVWFTRPANTKLRRHIVAVVIALFVVGVLAIYAIIGLTDVARLPQTSQLAVHLAVAVVAVVE